MNRPDPQTFAQFSYYLAFGSGAIILLAFLLSMIQPVSFLSQIIWLTVITSSVGTVLAFAARSDFRRMDAPPEDAQHQAKIGLRINLITVVIMLLLTVFAVLSNIIFAV